jgi:hypothetical protein
MPYRAVLHVPALLPDENCRHFQAAAIFCVSTQTLWLCAVCLLPNAQANSGVRAYGLAHMRVPSC